MGTTTAFPRRTWIPLVLLLACAGLVLLGIRVGTLESSHSIGAYTELDSLACDRPATAPDGSMTAQPVAAHISSLRDIVDPGAPNYCTPSDSRWGVLGAFPGDTTIVVEQGQYLVAARLVGQPGDTLQVQWGDLMYPIVAVYGGGIGWKQRYITVHNDRHYMLPIQWNEQSSTWEPYGVERWFEVSGPAVPDVDDSLEGRCSDCHREDEAGRTGMVFVGTE